MAKTEAEKLEELILSFVGYDWTGAEDDLTDLAIYLVSKGVTVAVE